ncbi:MAG: hypothetical protein HQL67_12445 [Magnetococcales bacterium]|nr:hypothetical protein [Magnetococcales bacterium]
MSIFTDMEDALHVFGVGPDHPGFYEAVVYMVANGGQEIKAAIEGYVEAAIGRPMIKPDICTSDGSPGFSRQAMAQYLGATPEELDHVISEVVNAKGGRGLLDPGNVHTLN